MKKVCVIGCGVISENHLRALAGMKDIQIAGVCDMLEERAAAKAAAYGCPAFTDYKQMLQQVQPDAVHLCLPHYLHSPVAVACLEAGVDVLSEKPMNATYAGAVAMRDTARRTGRRLGVIFQNRYNSGSVLAKKVLTEGRLGKLLTLSGLVMWHRDEAYYASGTWRRDYATSGGGVIINQAIHTLDLIRWLADSPVESVDATVSHHGDTTAEVEDTTEGVIRFENGARGLFYFTINNGQDDSIVLHAHGTEGDLTVTGGRCTVCYRDGRTESDKGSKETFCGAKAVYGSSHAIQIEQFYHGTDAEVAQTVEEALKTQALIQQIFRSAGRDAE